MLSKKIHNIITKEPWLINADGTYVSQEWVGKRRACYIMNLSSVVAFVLYDVSDCIYLHMAWVDKAYRKQGLAKHLIKMIMDKHGSNLYAGYANKNSWRMLKSMGFSIGKIEYREVFYRHP